MNFFLRQPTQSNTCRRMLLTFAAALSLAIAGEAAAGNCQSTSANVITPMDIDFTGNQNIQTPKNVPIGTVLWHSTPVAVNPVSMDCSYDLPLSIYGYSTGQLSQGETNIPIGTTGLSYRLKTSNPVVGQYVASDSASITNGRAWTPDFKTLTLEIVKTGQFNNVSTLPNGPFASYFVSNAVIFQFKLNGVLRFTPLTCTTPSITVPMGVRKSSDFNGIGTRLSPTGFTINLNACPAGINSIKYRLDSTTTVTNPAASVVALSTDSIAEGVGVQILDNMDNPFPLGVDTVLSNYNDTGGNFSIPLKAAYYQTASTIKGGAANTSLTFTMTYE